MTFSSGKNAWGLCDQCGFRYKYLDLARSSYGTWVCPSCYDGQFDLKNHPQNGPFPVDSDNEGLEHPRPDVVLATSGDAGWTPNQSIQGDHYGGNR
jgi:hypothetical protein